MLRPPHLGSRCRALRPWGPFTLPLWAWPRMRLRSSTSFRSTSGGRSASHRPSPLRNENGVGLPLVLPDIEGRGGLTCCGGLRNPASHSCWFRIRQR